MTEPTQSYVTEPIPPLSDYAVLLQRLAAHLQVVAGLLHDVAEYDPAPDKFRVSLAAIAAQFSFMDSSSGVSLRETKNSDPARSPDVQRALSAARARTTTSILAQLDAQVARSQDSRRTTPVVAPTCGECGGKMELVGWTLTQEGTAVLWGCPQECLPPEPDYSNAPALQDFLYDPFCE